ncbi:hypothetical protein ACSFCC_11950, partial [Glaesserella parasuis]|uniref:hypothetical protein n=1 Tax=Glaesserella parasuis TaxID=738 RepID=UPI003F3E36D0
EEPACQCRRHKSCGFDPWLRKIMAWQPTPVFLPGECQGQRSLAGSSSRAARVGYDLATTPPPPPCVFVGSVDVNGSPWKSMTSAMLVAFLSFIFFNYSVIFDY